MKLASVKDFADKKSYQYYGYDMDLGHSNKFFSISLRGPIEALSDWPSGF